jgi:hypothetical protein
MHWRLLDRSSAMNASPRGDDMQSVLRGRPLENLTVEQLCEATVLGVRRPAVTLRSSKANRRDKSLLLAAGP